MRNLWWQLIRRVPTRGWAAWSVLQGKPTVYRVRARNLEVHNVCFFPDGVDYALYVSMGGCQACPECQSLPEEHRPALVGFTERPAADPRWFSPGSVSFGSVERVR